MKAARSFGQLTQRFRGEGIGLVAAVEPHDSDAALGLHLDETVGQQYLPRTRRKLGASGEQEQRPGMDGDKFHRISDIGVAVTPETMKMPGIDILRGIMNGTLPQAGIS